MMPCIGRNEWKRNMQWSNKTPTIPGWYWWRVDSSWPAHPVDLRAQNDLLDAQERGGEWAGPIEVPKEG